MNWSLAKKFTSFATKIKMDDKKFQKIIEFYLLNCPVEGTSRRACTFEKYDIKTNAQFSDLKKKMLEISSPSLKEHYFGCKKNELETRFELFKTLKSGNEACIFLIHSNRRVIESLFSTIRNAIAHGEFNIISYNGEKFYFFSNYNKYQKAELVLKEETLISWINLIKKFSK